MSRKIDYVGFIKKKKIHIFPVIRSQLNIKYHTGDHVFFHPVFFYFVQSAPCARFSRDAVLRVVSVPNAWQRTSVRHKNTIRLFKFFNEKNRKKKTSRRLTSRRRYNRHNTVRITIIFVWVADPTTAALCPLTHRPIRLNKRLRVSTPVAKARALDALSLIAPANPSKGYPENGVVVRLTPTAKYTR